MNKIYAALSTIALLFSLPSAAAELEAKSQEKDATTKGKEFKADQFKDKIIIKELKPGNEKAPICLNGG